MNYKDKYTTTEAVNASCDKIKSYEEQLIHAEKYIKTENHSLFVNMMTETNKLLLITKPLK